MIRTESTQCITDADGMATLATIKTRVNIAILTTAAVIIVFCDVLEYVRRKERLVDGKDAFDSRCRWCCHCNEFGEI
jgi:hypothetical protein